MTDLTSYIAILISVAAVIPLYIDLYSRRREKDSVEFELELLHDESENAYEVNDRSGIRVLHPTKPIDHCKILPRNTPLVFWDSDPTILAMKGRYLEAEALTSGFQRNSKRKVDSFQTRTYWSW